MIGAMASGSAKILLPRGWCVVPAVLACSITMLRAAEEPVPLSQLFAERVRSVVAVEFFVETETERRPSTVVSMVADDDGLVVLLDSAIPGWLAPDQLKDFRIFLPGSSTGFPADYLGQDYLTGWHFIRARVPLGADVVPCVAYAACSPLVGDEVWGIGLMGKEFDYQPYLMASRVSLLQKLPQQVGFCVNEVASPGAPVFARGGEIVGWAGNSTPQERLLFLQDDRFNVGLQNPNGSGNFHLATEVLPYLDRVPSAPIGQDVPWLGVIGLQPVDREVAEFLKLEKGSAVVISDVIPEGPAAAAGLEKRDIIVSLNGAPLPRFSPERVVTAYLEHEVLLRKPGDVMRFGIVRGSDRIEREVTVGRQPKPLKEALRQYFPRLGITLREFVLFDRVTRQLEGTGERGVVTNFVKPNTPAAAAGLRSGDLIMEIDGQVSDDYHEAIKLMDAIEQDVARSEFVLLVSRGAETQVIRVRLK